MVDEQPMTIFKWIFGKHLPRPPDPGRSAAVAKVPRWQAEMAIAALHEAGIDATFADDFTAYLTTASHESTVTIFAMEPDVAAGRELLGSFSGLDDDAAPPVIRPIDPSSADDIALLRAMLYAALFVPADAPPFALDIVDAPELMRYIADFGSQPTDRGWCAEAFSGELLGAAWVRQLSGGNAGYGYVDDDTPELTVAVAPAHRGQGLGTALLTALVDEVGRCSLSCDVRNPAIALYHRQGFETVRTAGDSVVMLRR
jgi:ribosomal protein S18 acetylase RimI-like enzyme